MGVNSLPKIVTRQHRGCDLNPGPSAPESNTLTTRLPSHPKCSLHDAKCGFYLAANAIFGKIRRVCYEEVISQLMKSKCLSVLLYC